MNNISAGIELADYRRYTEQLLGTDLLPGHSFQKVVRATRALGRGEPKALREFQYSSDTAANYGPSYSVTPR